jgi:hypothetical protein
MTASSCRNVQHGEGRPETAPAAAFESSQSPPTAPSRARRRMTMFERSSDGYRMTQSARSFPSAYLEMRKTSPLSTG